MINLLRIIKNFFFRHDIIKFYRFPPAKRFRTHLLGLTCALFFTLMYLIFDYSAIFSEQPWFVPVLTFLILIAGTCFLWWTFLAIVIIMIILKVQIATPIIELYFWTYLSGALFAIIYNDLIYLWQWLFEKDKVKIVFAFDPRKKVNIIKSPIINEETVPLKLQECLYDYEKCEAENFHPYTIVFWANKKFKEGDNPSIEDPISKDRNLFLRSVEKALAVLETNEVLGRPEIWSKIRIIAIFEGTEVSGNGENSHYARSLKLEMDGEPVENLITPKEDVDSDYIQLMRERINTDALTAESQKAFAEKIDVIYILSAVDKYTRGTALFSDISGFEKTGYIKNINGIKFEFAYKNYDVREYRQRRRYKAKTLVPTKPYKCIHDFYAKIPGRIAINVRTAPMKTYIHEFAHAMSSAWNGVIVDEYFDDLEIDSKDINIELSTESELNNSKNNREIPFCVNRFIRQRLNKDKLLGIPHTFAIYQETKFKSDLEHPSTRFKWIGYFPERHRKDFICTMDTSFCTYRFDDLIAAFMYDRLMTKINRPEYKEK
ncbi:hypothetical protein JW964_17350 [candidate division KSB1 bacterium]|nr:hypothetical protein [candidate division KSB1 bacterium]